MERAVIRKWAVMALLGVVLMAAGPHPDLIAAESPDDYRVISDKFIITLGSYITDFETDAAVGSDGLLGTFIRMEDELGITDDDSLFRVDGLYRFNRRHAIGFGFWTVNRDGAAVLGEDIDFDGNIFKAGVAVLSELDTT
ncbi:MAG: hypothetical protein O7F16_00095 [Acidobacteria bacterium]|nr:hypothetical protein [Acidobacteriota bacterium]